MTQEALDKESHEIIKALTQPKPEVHLAARLVALSRRGIHKFLYENPEIAEDEKTVAVVERIVEYVGAAMEIVMDYEIAYKEGIDYENRIITTGRESGSISVERSNSGRVNSDSPGNTDNNVVNPQGRATSTGRTNNPSRGDNGRTSGVFKPPRKPEQPERPERGKPDSKPKSRSKSKRYSDE